MKFGFENNKVANMCKCTKKYRSKQNKNKNKIQRLLEIIPFNGLRQSYTSSPDLFTPHPTPPSSPKKTTRIKNSNDLDLSQNWDSPTSLRLFSSMTISASGNVQYSKGDSGIILLYSCFEPSLKYW